MSMVNISSIFQMIKKDLKKYSKIFEQKDRLSQSKASKVWPVFIFNNQFWAALKGMFNNSDPFGRVRFFLAVWFNRSLCLLGSRSWWTSAGPWWRITAVTGRKRARSTWNRRASGWHSEEVGLRRALATLLFMGDLVNIVMCPPGVDSDERDSNVDDWEEETIEFFINEEVIPFGDL